MGPPLLKIESHSIDFIPLAERYGTPHRLFTIWFSANMTILGVALGTLGIEADLSLGWTRPGSTPYRCGARQGATDDVESQACPGFSPRDIEVGLSNSVKRSDVTGLLKK